MAISHKPSVRFSICSLLMATLFAYSASVQLNDPDWYLWFPLYAFAFGIHLLQSIRIFGRSKWVAGITFCMALFLFLKVVYEAYAYGGFGEVASLDMEKRVVREKLGSGLVLISMFFQYKASDVADSPVRVRREQIWKTIEYGMLMLVALSFGLSVTFVVLVKEIQG
ncbi:uncharacterized protein LOC116250951 [Nymphaea colorata]|nr:uncharacterized protein LOC116250951 [Nymphaea colorata]